MEVWLPGTRGKAKGNCYLMSTVSVWQDEESSGDWLHDHVNVLDTPELYI